jgi:tight adherence protein B
MAIELVASVFVFVAVTAGALAVFSRAPMSRVAEKRLEAWRRPPQREGLDPNDVLRRGTSAVPFLRSFLSNGAWSQRAAIDLQRAGSRLKVSEYLLLRLLVGAAVGLIALLVTRGGLLGVLLAVLLALVGFMLPALHIRLRKRRRSATIDRQLVETLQLITNALRSGFAFAQAVDLAAKQMAPPIKDELIQLLRDVGLGAPMDEALRAMVERSGSYDLDMTVTAMLVQRTTGGNLSEVLDNVGETMRERERIRAEIQSLTASQRLTGLILSIWPVVLGLLFFVIAPSIMSVLWTDPLGRIVLAIGIGLQLLGFFTIRRVLDIDI